MKGYGTMRRCPECGSICESSLWDLDPYSGRDEFHDVCPVCGLDVDIISIMKIEMENGKYVYREE